MECELKGKFLENIEIAQELRNNGFEVNMNNGKITVPNISMFSKCCLYLKKGKKASKEKLLDLRQELYEKMNLVKTLKDDYKIISKEHKKKLYKSNNKYLSIEEKENNFLLEIKNNNEDNQIIGNKINKIVIPFYISKRSPIYSVIDEKLKIENNDKTCMIETIKYDDYYILKLSSKVTNNFKATEKIVFNFSKEKSIQNIYDCMTKEKQYSKKR